MYARSQTWIENGPPRRAGIATRGERIRRRRGMGSTASEAWCELVGCSLPPGSSCYDVTFMPGMIHGANAIQALFNSNATMSTSAAERACLAGGPTPQPIVTIIPPGPPVNYDPNTGGPLPGTTLSPAPSTVQVNTGCPDGTTDCLAPGGGDAGCSWWCGIPGSGTFDSTCITCPNTGLGQAVLIGLLGLAAAALFGVLKK
jgi:hypothetical protein